MTAQAYFEDEMPTDPSDTRLLREITLRNLLSFGPDTPTLALGNLNVLIGPNGSGKSNLVEALTVLRAAPSDLREVIRLGGGVLEWVWKGAPEHPATIDVVIQRPNGQSPLRHVLELQAESQTLRLADERIEPEAQVQNGQRAGAYYSYHHGNAVIMTQGQPRTLAPGDVEANRSILAQRRDPDNYPEISFLAGAYERIRVYREWAFGRNTVFRQPQRADMRTDRLEEDFSNLGLFLNRLRRYPAAKQTVLGYLRDLYEGLTDFDVSIEAGTVQVFLTEGHYTIPATRLSDGTLRYLCLLAILCDPEPPALVCIEEPELGLHPDILPKLADLLIDASRRSQLLVTTHSDILVDALTGVPEAIVVCEKHGGQSRMNRLDPTALEHWLGKYRLGELWTSGELGGTIW